MTLKNRQNLIKCRHTQRKRDGARETETEQERQGVGEEWGKRGCMPNKLPVKRLEK